MKLFFHYFKPPSIFVLNSIINGVFKAIFFSFLFSFQIGIVLFKLSKLRFDNKKNNRRSYPYRVPKDFITKRQFEDLKNIQIIQIEDLKRDLKTKQKQNSFERTLPSCFLVFESENKTVCDHSVNTRGGLSSKWVSKK